MVKAETFRTNLKVVEKNPENMSSRVYNFSTMENIRMQYELYKEFHGPKRSEAAFQKDTERGDKET